jgi:argininosuccinate lyase
MGESLDPQVLRLTSSLAFDRRLAPQDVRAGQAWARALAQAGVLTTDELQQIEAGLAAIAAEFADGRFSFAPTDEDIHTAVERRLKETVGPLAGKLHTGRSRNDQVATDLRLWLLDGLQDMAAALLELQSALVDRAQSDQQVVMPGFTHLQPAQPILLSHWWLSHFWALDRDHARLDGVRQRVDVLPLGSAALAGTTYPIDRAALAADLGFATASCNSLDAVSDRDFAAEFLFFCALTSVHLSRLAEGVILFSTPAFGFVEVGDDVATGSSLMPQKKNPDVFELARAKAGTLLGRLTGLLATLKALPSAYDRDLQEDKVPVFEAYDTLAAFLPVLADAIRNLTVHPERTQAALTADLYATDLADYLVARGVAFRQAHEVVGRAVRLALERGQPLDQLSPTTLQKLDKAFGEDVAMVFDPSRSVARHAAFGGTAPAAVARQLDLARQTMRARLPRGGDHEENHE